MDNYKYEQIKKIIEDYEEERDAQGSEYGRKCVMESAFKEIYSIVKENYENN